MIPRTKIRLADLPNHPPRGVALIIVLGFLVLITALVVAYFTTVTTERTASKSYTSGVSTKMLADTAVNVVQGQIAQATQGQVAGSSTRLTWASQPGMIRTYDDTGAAANCYKLYSSGTMVIPAAQVSTALGLNGSAGSDVPPGWNSQPAIYTDINAPVKDSSGVLNFPIMDGNHLQPANISGSSVLTYISTSGAKPDIEGSYISSTAIANTYNQAVATSATNNPVPMPVQWIYMLQDGAVISPDSGGNGTTATFNTALQAMTPAQQHLFTSGSNPIVGRMAFWTDDETCKLNINTASEGSYYDSPHLNTPTDMWNASASYGFAMSPPAHGEYSRYPGHPATTCLSVALGHWLDNTAFGQTATAPNAYSSVSNNSLYLGLTGTSTGLYKGLSAYLLLSPRNQIGGSLAGTVNESYVLQGGTSFPSIPCDSDRLYASPDELIFRYPNANDPGPPAPRAAFPDPNLSGTSGKSAMEELKFFLTASSRAPELTPFDTPKVSMWPQWFTQADRNDPTNYADFNESGKGYVNTPDPAKQANYGLLAFCSSFGMNNTLAQSMNWPGKKNEYFFQWYNTGKANNSGQHTSVTPGNPSFHFATQDWDEVPRNQQLAKYLCNLGSQAIPGYGAAFTGVTGQKYSQLNFSNIVLESLDFIRSNVAYVDCVVASNPAAWGQPISPLVVSGSTSVSATASFVGLSGSNAIKGYGFDQFCTEILIGATVSSTAARPFIAFDAFHPSLSLESMNPFMAVTIKNPANLGLIPLPGGQPIAQQFTALQPTGPPETTETNYLDPIKGYLLYSGSLASCTFQQSGTSAGATISIGSGQPVTFDILDDASQNVVQEITVTFPPGFIPLPTTATSHPSDLGCIFITGTQAFVSLSSSAASVVTTACSTRAMIATAQSLNGDWRLLGGLTTVPSGMFTTSTNYNSNASQVDGFYVELLNNTQPVCLNNVATKVPTTSIAGSLVSLLKNTDYIDGSAPCVPPGLSSALMANGQPGDWDTGPGMMPDGPYISPAEKYETVGSGDYLGHSAPRDFGGLFSPNRMVASPVRFGSLPTGISENPPQPWQTLLFCPNPAGRQTPAGTTPGIGDHRGFMSPPDHLYLDFFTMPIVDPYAISEPLSTAGKVNLNCQLAPFTYIERSTALRGVLKNTLVTGISGYDVKGTGTHPTNGSNENVYKWESDMPGTQRCPYEMRYDINRDATIAGIEEHYFSKGQLFMYPSQICDVFLVPQYLAPDTLNNHPSYNQNDATPPGSFATSAPTLTQLQAAYDNMVTWWNAPPPYKDLSKMSLTGDNLREEPYNHLYPRLTTQSNTYTVHCRVQALQKSTASIPVIWNEGQDHVVAEYRGCSLIERYVDPNDPQMNDQWDSDTISLNLDASKGGTADLSRLYKFRVISTKKFAP